MMKFDEDARRALVRVLHTTGILVSLATFILHALPVRWGIFLSAACFIVGGMLWGTRKHAPRRP